MILNLDMDNIVKMEKNNLSAIIRLYKNQKALLLNYIKKFTALADIIDVNYAKVVSETLRNAKNFSNECTHNIRKLKNLSSALNGIDINYLAKKEKLLARLLEMQDFTLKLSSDYQLSFIQISHESTVSESEKKDVKKRSTDAKYPVSGGSNIKIDAIDTSKYQENTLLISETKDKVVLPYTIENLISTLTNNVNKYSNIDEIIEKDYTLPMERFKNSPVSRFKEAFDLVIYKEKGSIKSAIHLATELLFNYNLHPAIITACKNLDELYIYLDYLETNELEKFNIFKITFEVE